MKRKMHSKIATGFVSSLAMVSLAISGNAFADKVKHQNKVAAKPAAKVIHHHHRKLHKLHKTADGWELGQGWLLTSTGGLSYVHPNDDSYWVKVSGTVRLDETVYMGNYRDKGTAQFQSGALLRTADLYLDGGLGKNWEYTISLDFAESAGSHFGFGDTWLAYSGFMENNQVFVGQVAGNWFGLDNSNSTSWNAFLEKSIQSSAFYIGDGLGVMTDFWWDMGAVTLVAMQPEQGSNGIAGVRDRWKGTARATIAPKHEAGDVWHFGVSGAWREMISSLNGTAFPNAGNPTGGGVNYTARPPARSRNTVALLNTASGNGGVDSVLNGQNIVANNTRHFNVEAARQVGPFMLEGEYTNVFVHRMSGYLGTLRFSGYNVQSRYLLTGEYHQYDVRDGQFGAVNPVGPYGAFEIAARYDFVDLNNKDVRGGMEHDVTVGFNWFVNKQVRLSMNYVHASIHPALDAQQRNLDIIGMRTQIRFK